MTSHPGQPGQPAGSSARRPPIDLGRLFERLGGDGELVLDVARLFLEDCPTQLATIQTAIDMGDAARIRVAAHTLKGAAGNLSASGLQHAAAELEQLGAESRLDAAAACWKQVIVEASLALEALRTLPGVNVRPIAGDEACGR